MRSDPMRKRFPVSRVFAAWCLSLLAIFSVSIAKADPAQIVMLTWRGETAAEQGFVQGLERAAIDAEITTFDAQRDRLRLSEYIRDNIEMLRSAT